MLIPELIKKQICLLEVEGLSKNQWFRLFRVLRHKSLTASFYTRLVNKNKQHEIPLELHSAFLSAVTFSDAQKRQVDVQLQKLCELFAVSGIEFVMLKGAAYIASDTPNSSGRLMSDIDICVHRSDLSRTEKALKQVSWQVKELDNHDEKYYREWSHELPPYYHPFDGVSLDVHHTLYPPVSAKHIDIQKLFKESIVTNFGVKSPSPEWLVFHSAIHLIANEDVENGLRDLIDIYLLLTQGENKIDISALVFLFENSGFKTELSLLKQLLWDYFDYNLPLEASGHLQSGSFQYQLRLWAIRRAVCPESDFVANTNFRLARFINYVIGYSQKMPMSLLAKHLLFKGGRNIVKAILGDFYFRKNAT
ncbi:nucleotidyltransferase domain-containing protein [Alteromonas lipolytica]|uniref:Nucleotidyltransferase n=1 Tax=Alteromonas lipolytica TaxID=1856405 RepID=A0A1E8FE96_9ALTE|nr:nucleotidyltransferase family protein [Alteromonas lipolytica]OFI34086.1 hypothetical protein BFC17_21300 [Alteromonas lipolytica]GGF65531.1 hypothetical protein GCM10011338_17360 [Alteromonas lipolytica]